MLVFLTKNWGFQLRIYSAETNRYRDNGLWSTVVNKKWLRKIKDYSKVRV